MVVTAEAWRPRVLIAEDDADERSSFAAALCLELPGADIETAENGGVAWELVRHGGVDVLLADIGMPVLDGFELVQRISHDGSIPDVYIILLTGTVPEERLYAALGEGADDCLLKPFRVDELVMRVRAGIRRIGASRRLSSRIHDLEGFAARQSEFLSVVSHEIRTPLSAILSSANILRRYGNQRPDSVERFARVIDEEGRRLTRLINNLLDLTKIEAGQVEWRFEPVAVGELIDGVRESFSALAGERRLSLIVNCVAPEEDVVVDRDRLTQVLVNLVSNAIKHSPEGGKVELRCRGAASGCFRLEVEDEGSGIPPGCEERIFERFEQLEVGDERGGSGLGLTISKHIVEHHGGRIWAESGRRAGALFVVELPRTYRNGAGDGAV